MRTAYDGIRYAADDRRMLALRDQLAALGRAVMAHG
jgi:hypothetical protein